MASVPLDVSVFGFGTIRALGGDAITNFSLLQPGDGLFDFVGSSDVLISIGHTTTGSIPVLSGVADSKTFNKEETQILFSPYGEALVSFKPNWVGEGVLFTFNSVVEKAVYEWVGSGTLFGFNNTEEARVYVYDCASIVEFETPDYGFVERSLLTETVSGDISGSTSASTVRVDENGSARIISGQSYRSALNSDIATEFAEYGYITDAANALIDYGHILDTPRQGLPGCIYGEIEISGAATSKLQPTYIAEGFISKLTGEATVPLDVSVPIFGTIGKLSGESVPNFSLLHPGDGQIRVQGTLSNVNLLWDSLDQEQFQTQWSIRSCCIQSRREADALLVHWRRRYSHESMDRKWKSIHLQTAVERKVYNYVGSGRSSDSTAKKKQEYTHTTALLSLNLRHQIMVSYNLVLYWNLSAELFLVKQLVAHQS